MRRYITEEFRAPVSKALNNALRGVEVSNFQFVLFTKDGARVQVGRITFSTLVQKTRGCCCAQILLNASTRRDAAGNIVGAIFVGNDTTDLKRAELRARGAAEDVLAAHRRRRDLPRRE